MPCRRPASIELFKAPYRSRRTEYPNASCAVKPNPRSTQGSLGSLQPHGCVCLNILDSTPFQSPSFGHCCANGLCSTQDPDEQRGVGGTCRPPGNAGCAPESRCVRRACDSAFIRHYGRINRYRSDTDCRCTVVIRDPYVITRWSNSVTWCSPTVWTVAATPVAVLILWMSATTQLPVALATTGAPSPPPVPDGPVQNRPPSYPVVVGVPLLPPARSGVTASADVLDPTAAQARPDNNQAWQG